MKAKKLKLVIAGSSILTLGLAGSALAFHDGGVAHCDGCHSMHNSAENAANVTNAANLMKGSDASSTCLNCHSGSGRYHIASADGTNVNEGGDFYWMQTSYIYDTGHSTPTSTAENHGHNIVAADYGFIADTVNLTAPGGTYDATLLGCTSCHDAHGQVNGGTKNGSLPVAHSGSYGAGDVVDATGVTVAIAGNFRLLGDSVYTAGNGDDGYAFSNDAPVAVTVNGAVSYGEATDYGSGMGQWCANCHTDYTDATKSDKHPIANLGGTSSNNYNKYVKTGDFTGVVDTAYDGLVPIERGTTDVTLLDPTSTVGADAASVVMCLTCHRAHASGFANAGRWDFGAAMLAESSVLTSTDLAATAVAYYKNGAAVDVVATYGEYQRSLCNKCHVQD